MSSRSRTITGKKKRKSGTILRLIDVIFILLFGFIAISEVEQKSRIKLAKSQTKTPDLPDKEIVEFIGVLPDGRYLVEKETMQLENVDELNLYLDLKKEQFSQQEVALRIRVRANYDAAVKYAFPVVEACKELEIPVGLDVIKKGNRSK